MPEGVWYPTERNTPEAWKCPHLRSRRYCAVRSGHAFQLVALAKPAELVSTLVPGCSSAKATFCPSRFSGV